VSKRKKKPIKRKKACARGGGEGGRNLEEVRAKRGSNGQRGLFFLYRAVGKEKGEGSGPECTAGSVGGNESKGLGKTRAREKVMEKRGERFDGTHGGGCHKERKLCIDRETGRMKWDPGRKKKGKNRMERAKGGGVAGGVGEKRQTPRRSA